MSKRSAKMMGVCFQGIVIGTLLLITIIEIIDKVGGNVVFRYQGF